MNLFCSDVKKTSTAVIAPQAIPACINELKVSNFAIFLQRFSICLIRYITPIIAKGVNPSEIYNPPLSLKDLTTPPQHLFIVYIRGYRFFRALELSYADLWKCLKAYAINILLGNAFAS